MTHKLGPRAWPGTGGSTESHLPSFLSDKPNQLPRTSLFLLPSSVIRPAEPPLLRASPLAEKPYLHARVWARACAHVQAHTHPFRSHVVSSTFIFLGCARGPAGMGRTGQSHTLSCFNSIAPQGIQMRTSAVGGGRAVLGAAGRGRQRGTRPGKAQRFRRVGWAGGLVLLDGDVCGIPGPGSHGGLDEGLQRSSEFQSLAGEDGGRESGDGMCVHHPLMHTNGGRR